MSRLTLDQIRLRYAYGNEIWKENCEVALRQGQVVVPQMGENSRLFQNKTYIQ